VPFVPWVPFVVPALVVGPEVEPPFEADVDEPPIVVVVVVVVVVPADEPEEVRAPGGEKQQHKLSKIRAAQRFMETSRTVR
jgi:hypothetical protein